MTGVRTKRVEIGEHSLVFDLHGDDGPAVLLLHGIPGWRGTFREVAEDLAVDHRVLVPDLVGFGESSVLPPGWHAAEQAEVLAHFLDAQGVGEVHLCGFDFGGPIALLLMQRVPEKVRSLTLMATNVLTDTPIPVPLKLARVPLLGDLAFRVFFGRLGLTAMWRAAAADRRAFPLDRYREALVFGQGVASTRRIFLESLRDLPGLYADVEIALGSVRVPGAVLWGERDPFFSVEVGERTARRAALPLSVLQGCGHFVPQERPQAVAEALRRVSGQAGTHA